MNILQYIESKKTYYESMENEYRLSYKKNQNMMRELSDRLQILKQKEKEADFQGRFSTGKKDENLEQDIEKIENRICKLKEENEEYQEKIVECVEELRILHDLVCVEDSAEVDANIKNKIQFCSKIVLQDPQRCKMELEELLRAISS